MLEFTQNIAITVISVNAKLTGSTFMLWIGECGITMDSLEKTMALFNICDEEEGKPLWDEVEEKCEGKTISTLSANGHSGIIIRFTDGSKFSMIGSQMSFDDAPRKEK